MANQKDVDLLFAFIKSMPDKHNRHRTAYQLGCLIGFIASLMADDSIIRNRILHKLNTNKK